jgi:hypothetical protein
MGEMLFKETMLMQMLKGRAELPGLDLGSETQYIVLGKLCQGLVPSFIIYKKDLK